MSDNEPFCEDTITPVKIRRFSFNDTSGSSDDLLRQPLDNSDEKKEGPGLKSRLVSTQNLQRPFACKLIDDGAECYVAYRDYALD